MEMIALNLEFYECTLPSGSLGVEEVKMTLTGIHKLWSHTKSFPPLFVWLFNLETKSSLWNSKSGSQGRAVASKDAESRS